MSFIINIVLSGPKMQKNSFENFDFFGKGFGYGEKKRKNFFLSIYDNSYTNRKPWSSL
jgi:hypothetical protein